MAGKFEYSSVDIRCPLANLLANFATLPHIQL